MNARQIVNSDRPNWTTEQDDFLRKHADLPNQDLASAVSKKFHIHRSRESVRKRKQRLRKYAARSLGGIMTPKISLSIGGLELSAPVTQGGLKKLMGAVKFTDVQPVI